MLVAALVPALLPAQSKQPPAAGVADTMIAIPSRTQRQIRGRDVHTHVLQLAAGQGVQLTVMQAGHDVELTLVAPDSSRRVVRQGLDGAMGGNERLTFVTVAAGRHTVRVRSTQSSGVVGSYTLVVQPVSASLSTAAVVAAESLLAAGVATRGKETPDSIRVAAAMARRARAAADAAGDVYVSLEAALLEGDSHVELRQFDSAKIVLDEALRLATASHDSIAVLRARYKLSVAAFTAGDGRGATQRMGEAVRFIRPLGLPIVEAQLEEELGYVLTLRGVLDSARTHIDRSLALARQSGELERIKLSLTGLSRLHQRSGDYEGQIRAMREMTALVHSAADTIGEAAALNNLAQAYADVGRDAESLDNFERAAKLLENQPEPRGRARVLGNLGYALRKRDPDGALRRYEQALRLLDEIDDRTGQIASLVNMAQIYIDSKRDAGPAVPLLQRASGLVNRDSDPRTASIVTGTLGKAFNLLGQKDSALSNFRLTMDLSARAGDLRTQAITSQVIAAFWEKQEAFDSSRVALERGIATWERIWRTGQVTGNRTTLFEEFSNYYEFETDLLYRKQQVSPDSAWMERAFDLAERARARSFLESLRDVRDRASAQLDSASRAELRTARQAIERASSAYTRGPSAATSRAVDSTLAEYDALQATVRARSANYRAVTEVVTTPLSRIQRELLDSGTVLLEYQLGNPRSHLWVITPQRVAAFRLPGRDSLTALVVQLRKALGARGDGAQAGGATALRARLSAADREFTHLARRLSDILLLPAAPYIADKRLVIVPHGSLFLLPFASLPDPAAGDGASSQPLVVAHQIAYLPSASSGVLIRGTARRSSPGTRLAIFGDPVFSSRDPRLAATLRGRAAPGARGTTQSPGDTSAVRVSLRATGVLRDDGQLQRLPFSRREAQDITDIVGVGNSRAGLDFDANLTAATDSVVEHAHMIHFASHALLNAEKPELSGIVLSQVDRSGRPIEGFLRLHHIYNLQLNAALVVLSACETALGQRLNGEGVISLARAFLQVGAGRVVASLWSADDRASAEFMADFYRGMVKGGLSAAAAMRQAQVTMMQHPRFSAPFYWAAFQLTGEWK